MRWLLTMLMLVVLPAWAGDIKATYAIEDGESLTLQYRDASHVRMETPDGGFLLVKGDKVWMVQRDGKKWIAMDMAEMGKMMQGFGMSGMPGMDEPEEDFDPAKATFKRTARTETVAGYKGHVYEVSDGKGEVMELVLTDHKDVQAASRAFLSMTAKAASNMGMSGLNSDKMMEMLAKQAETGVLRQGDNLRLTSLSTASLPDATFELPPGTQIQSMPAMPAMPKGMPGMPEGFSFPR